MISLAHSVAISSLADRIEREARLGVRIDDVLHLFNSDTSIGCIHVGPTKFELFGHISLFRDNGSFAGLAPVYKTPFGFCTSRDVAAELNLRQTFARSRLEAAREQGQDAPYLHVWE